MNARRLTMALAGVISATALALWLYSGMERLTKSGKPVQVAAEDELFADETRIELRAGPVFGYFVGADVVAIALGVSATAAGLVFFFTRRRSVVVAAQAGNSA